MRKLTVEAYLLFVARIKGVPKGEQQSAINNAPEPAVSEYDAVPPAEAAPAQAPAAEPSKDKPSKKKAKKSAKRSRKKTKNKKPDPAQEAINLVIETTEALYSERGDSGKLWGSMIKQTLKRRRPGFSESAYGFGSFSDLLEEGARRKQLEIERDEKSGGYIVLGTSASA